MSHFISSLATLRRPNIGHHAHRGELCQNTSGNVDRRALSKRIMRRRDVASEAAVFQRLLASHLKSGVAMRHGPDAAGPPMHFLPKSCQSSSPLVLPHLTPGSRGLLVAQQTLASFTHGSPANNLGLTQGAGPRQRQRTAGPGVVYSEHPDRAQDAGCSCPHSRSRSTANSSSFDATLVHVSSCCTR